MARKKPRIDSIERRIIRLMLSRKTPFTGNEIAIRIGLTPATVNMRMLILRRKGLVKAKKGKTRIFTRSFRIKIGGRIKKVRKRVKSPSRIFWFLNIRIKK